MEAGFLEANSSFRYWSVRPLSIMSSTITTWRPVMLESRSFIIRTTPVDLELAP